MKRLKFDRGYSEKNYHGTERKGEPWNRQQVTGWKVKWLCLEGHDRHSRLRTNIGRRLIIYKPSGAWWHFDVYWLCEEGKEK